MDKSIARSIIESELKKKGSIRIKVFGGSMSPVIRGNQTVTIIKTKKIKIGDIVCYKTKMWFLLHRVKSIDKIRGTMIVEGDSMDRVLHKIKINDILGAVKENFRNKIISVPVELMKKILKKKQKYEKPKLKAQRIFETSTLACGKCAANPIYQPSCTGFPRNS